MPLFFLLSGYVSTYGKVIETPHDIVQFIYKKTIQLYIPYLAFGYIIPLICKDKSTADIISTICNPQHGPWFLAVLWMIQLLLALVNYINYIVYNSIHLFQKEIKLLTYILGLIILIICNKLTDGSSYFTAIYYIMFVVGKYLPSWQKYIHNQSIAFICLILFSSIINSYIHFEGNKIILLGIQIMLSICVSFVVLYFCKTETFDKNIIYKRFAIIGRYSLNIYLMHYAIIQFTIKGDSFHTSINPIPLFIILFFTAYTTSELICGISRLIEKNKYLNFFLFGRKFW